MLGSGYHTRLRLGLDSLLHLSQHSRRAAQTGEQPNMLINLHGRPRQRAPLIRHAPSGRRNVSWRTTPTPGRRLSTFLHPYLWAGVPTCCSLRLQTREPHQKHENLVASTLPAGTSRSTTHGQAETMTPC